MKKNKNNKIKMKGKIKRSRMMKRILLTGIMITLFTGVALSLDLPGEGTEQEPYEISDWNDLNLVRDELEAHYELVNNLDEDTDGYSELIDTENGWEPIQGFSGTFDGQGYEIWKLKIISDVDPIGLFGSVESDGVVKDVGLRDIVEVGSTDHAFNHGTLVGNNDGLVKRCYAFGGTIAHKTGSNRHPAGLVGDGDGDVEECFSAIDIDDSRRGGIAGERSDLSITKVYSLTNILQEGDDTAGGIKGWNEGSLTNSYAAGLIEPEGDEAGGLIGRHRDFAGGSNLYWDTEATGQDKAAGEVDAQPDAEGLTTSEMQGSEAKTNMDNLDFEDTWETVEQEDQDVTEDGYPILQEVDRKIQLKAQGIYTEPPAAIARIGVDTNPNQQIEEWEWTEVEVGYGEQEIDPTELDLPTGYQYKVEYHLPGEEEPRIEEHTFETLMPPLVETKTVTGTDVDSTTLRGGITDSRDADPEKLKAGFQYAETGGDWINTSRSDIDTDNFSKEITELDPSTVYKYRAVVEWEDEEGILDEKLVATGDTEAFHTDQVVTPDLAAIPGKTSVTTVIMFLFATGYYMKKITKKDP